MDSFFTKIDPQPYDSEDVIRLRAYQTELIMLVNTLRDVPFVTDRLITEIRDIEFWLKNKTHLTRL